jgi:gluconokinase
VVFVFLNGPRELIEARMASRTQHYMPVSLLHSQLATLEPPTSDENVLEISISGEPEEQAAKVLEVLEGKAQA